MQFDNLLKAIDDDDDEDDDDVDNIFKSISIYYSLRWFKAVYCFKFKL